MSPEKPCIVGLGELVWDQLPSATMPGGAPGNFAFHVKQLGAEAFVVSAVGNDAAGDRLIGWLGEMGLSTDFVQRNARPTGAVTVRLDEHNQPRYTIHENVAWDHIEWNDALAALAWKADCVCVGSLSQRSEVSRTTIQRFLKATRPDCLRVFDVNIRQPHYLPQVINETLRQVEVLKLNDEEWPVVAHQLLLSPEYSSGLKELLRFSRLRYIAMTRGAKGSVIVDSRGLQSLPAEPISVEDTVGAGDAFTATLVMGILNGHPIHRVQINAAAIASFVCTRSGATPILPSALITPIVHRAFLDRLRSAAVPRLAPLADDGGALGPATAI